MEAYTRDLFYDGLVVAGGAWLWLLVRAFRDNVWWGLGSLLFPPIVFLYALRHAERAVGPLVVIVLAMLVMEIPAASAAIFRFDLRVREKFQDESTLRTFAERTLESDAAHELMEDRAFYLQSRGLAIAALGWICLLVRAFRQQRRWGFGSLIVPPLGIVFAGRFPRKGLGPLILCLMGLTIAATPALFTLFVPLDLGPLEKTVDGQLHLTLTGWNGKDYSLLRLKPEVVVLQMANPDVTDAVLESLVELKALQELDLTDTQVTDRGLKLLSDLPVLSKLRLARTKITDQGFHDFLSAKQSLMQLDLSGTEVRADTVREWQSAKSGRRVTR